MNKIDTIIVDDEKKSRDGLKKLLSNNAEIELIATCKNGLEAIDTIENYRPSLLLLDIQMPGISGFDVLKSISYKPVTIFITAFDKYALRAFEVHALDYLLKPFTNTRFHEAISNATTMIANNQHKHSIEALKKLVASLEQSGDANQAIASSYESNRLIIRTEGRIELIEHGKITWIEAYDYYVKIHAHKVFVIKDSLKNMGKNLPDHFMRVHKSSIINLKKLEALEPIGHSEMMATLTGGIQVKISRSYKDEMMKKLSNKSRD